MESSVPNFAKGVYSALRESFIQSRSAYMQMEQESDDEDNGRDMSHSLFYSVQQHHDALGDDSIPLTDSHGYSDRSQLMFENESSDESRHDLEPPHWKDDLNNRSDPATIYLNKDSDIEPPIPPTHPTSDSLLPTTSAAPTIPKEITSMKSGRKLRDPLFAALYCLCMVIFLLSGLITLLSTNSHALERAARGTMFKTMKDSAGLITGMASMSFFAGAIWISILRTFTRGLVWGTVVIIPSSLLGIFIWTLVESRQSNNLDGGLTALSFMPLITALVYIKLLYSSRHRISKTVAILELACDVLSCNPGIIVASVLVMFIFIGFTVLWMLLFSRLWLLGHVASSDSSSLVWIVNDNVYILAAFYIFIYFWTSGVLINIQRFVLSAVTAQWYFHRNEPAKPSHDITWKAGLLQASSTSLGTIAFGSLVLTMVQCLQYATQWIRKYFKMSWPFMTVISTVLSFIEGLISEINHYTIALAGITGEGFYVSAKSSSKMFRRNLLSGLLGDLMTKLILYVGSLVMALSSGFGTYIFATHSLRSPYGMLIGVLASMIPLYMSRFFSYTMSSIVDATFLCYAIDLDTGMVHMSAAHDVFSGFE
ncbi:hypothetical protein K492DRAFT_166411 [Lichtheimia hyalospora FSU 10163]|nr:hypothetical protein K492DRAFT_166411 [Lichtheimia hyalospora FSU 10163]